MAVSQNGWPAVASSSGLVPLRWVTGRVVGGDVHTILDYLGARFNAEVEPITVSHSWGWAHRPVRGATVLSNHASGTAVDFNAPKHPLGARGTFTAAQVAAIRRILAALGGTVRWGGDYSGRADEMHFEINASATQVAAAAARLRGGTAGAGGSAVARPTPPTSEEDTMSAAGEARIIELLEGITIDARDSVREGRARDKKIDGVVIDARDSANGAKRLPGITIDARDSVLGNRQILAELAGLRVAVAALASKQGLDPKAITAAVDAGVTSALARVETTVTVKPEASQ